MEPLSLALFVAGIVLLVVGAEGLVRGASRLAATFGISPLVIGLTVVAFGTSSPELAVSISSTAGGDPEIALGNVVGSNIFNVLLILGFSALVAPLIVAQQLIRLEVPLMIGASAVLLLFAADGEINRLEAGVFVVALIVYTAWAIRKSRSESRAVEAEYAAEFGERDTTPTSALRDAVLVLGGLGLLILGSEWFVNGATDMAESFGVSDLVIGLTVVAAGTSMPELATSILASFRGERDIAVGNVVGSNLFNILAVLGISGVVAQSALEVPDAALRFDIPVMLAVAVACLPIFFTGHLIARWEGLLFLCFYVAYTAYLLLNAAEHDALGEFSTVMLGLVLPLTAVTLAVLSWRYARALARSP